MSKQATTTEDGKVLIVDTDKGTYREAKPESKDLLDSILDPIADVVTGGIVNPNRK